MLNRSDITMVEWCRMFLTCYPIPFNTLAQAEQAATKLKAEHLVYDDAPDASGMRYFLFIGKPLEAV